MTKNPNRVKAGKKAKRKGNGNERKIAKLLQEWWGTGQFSRTPSSGGWKNKDAREDFNACGDVVTSATDFKYCVELKAQEGWTLDQLIHNDKCVIWSWWNQTIDETPDSLSPMLVFSRNRVKPVVMLDFHDPRTPKELFTYPHMIVCNKRGTFILLTFKLMMSLPPEYFGKEASDEECSTAV